MVCTSSVPACAPSMAHRPMKKTSHFLLIFSFCLFAISKHLQLNLFGLLLPILGTIPI